MSFITDDSGKKTHIVLPIEEYEELLQDLDDLAHIAKVKDEDVIPHKVVKKDLEKRNSTLQ